MYSSPFVRKHITIFLLLFIICIAGFLRFYRIDEVPVSLYWDEVASTYNAYSIAMTGKDEYGNWFPFLFRSFNDYKMPGNIYLTAPLTLFFGLNEFTARATSGLLGTLTVLITFFLVKEILLLNEKERKEKNQLLPVLPISFLASFLLALSPWHIQFSRTGFEANVALFFVVVGLWLFLRFLSRESLKMLFLSLLMYTTSLYFYRSVHLFVPLFLLVLFFYYRKELLAQNIRKNVILFCIISLIFAFPILKVSFSKAGLERVKQVNIFVEINQELFKTAQFQAENKNNLFVKIFYNRRLIYLREIGGNYLSHFGPSFLFVTGDQTIRHRTLGIGLVNAWSLPFIFIGFYVIFRFFDKRLRNILFAWMLIAPLPATFSFPAPHALRSLNILPFWQIIITIGIIATFLWLKNRTYRIIYAGTLPVVIIVYFFYYLQSYYGTTAKVASLDWGDGYKQAAHYVFTNEHAYEKVVISGHYWQPYIYILFFKKYDPNMFQLHGSKKGFDKYLFGGTSWDKEQYSRELDTIDIKKWAHANRVLVVLSPVEYEKQKKSIKALHVIRNHNNEIVFIVGETQ